MLERVLADLESQCNAGLGVPAVATVRLSGLVHSEERTAFQDIARQLCQYAPEPPPSPPCESACLDTGSLPAQPRRRQAVSMQPPDAQMLELPQLACHQGHDPRSLSQHGLESAAAARCFMAGS